MGAGRAYCENVLAQRATSMGSPLAWPCSMPPCLNSVMETPRAKSGPLSFLSPAIFLDLPAEYFAQRLTTSFVSISHLPDGAPRARTVRKSSPVGECHPGRKGLA